MKTIFTSSLFCLFLLSHTCHAQDARHTTHKKPVATTYQKQLAAAQAAYQTAEDNFTNASLDEDNANAFQFGRSKERKEQEVAEAHARLVIALQKDREAKQALDKLKNNPK